MWAESLFIINLALIKLIKTDYFISERKEEEKETTFFFFFFFYKQIKVWKKTIDFRAQLVEWNFKLQIFTNTSKLFRTKLTAFVIDWLSHISWTMQVLAPFLWHSLQWNVIKHTAKHCATDLMMQNEPRKSLVRRLE